MDKNDPVFNQDETVALGQQQADMFQWETCRRRYGRDCSPIGCNYLINNTIRYFNADRKYGECLPSMMTQRRDLMTLSDLYPTQNIIMNMDEDNIILTQIRCLQHCKWPSLTTYDIWFIIHRRNTISGVVECTVMCGPVVTGIRTTRNRPYDAQVIKSYGMCILDRQEVYKV
jgi:hypothetical protein